MSIESVEKGPGHAKKRVRARSAQNCLLDCFLPTVVASILFFKIDEVETKFLPEISLSEFSHSLGHERPFALQKIVCLFAVRLP